MRNYFHLDQCFRRYPLKIILFSYGSHFAPWSINHISKFEIVHYGENLCEDIWIVARGSGEVDV